MGLEDGDTGGPRGPSQLFDEASLAPTGLGLEQHDVAHASDARLRQDVAESRQLLVAPHHGALGEAGLVRDGPTERSVCRKSPPAKRSEVGQERSSTLVAVVGVLREQPVDDPADLGRHLRAELLQVGRRGDGMEPHDLARVRGLEWWAPGEALEDHGAERVKVRAAVDGPPHHAGLFRRAVEHGPDHRVVRLTGPRRRREPEVDQDGIAVGPEHYVARGYIPMDEADPVRCFESRCHVSRHGERPFLAAARLLPRSPRRGTGRR